MKSTTVNHHQRVIVRLPNLERKRRCSPASLTYNQELLHTCLVPTFGGKVAIASVSAVLAFIGAFVLSHLKKRSEPRKQLAYDINVRRGLVTIADDIRDKIEIRYVGQPIQNLYHVSVNVENSGNTVIKNQHLRFAFPSDAAVIELFLNPPPQPELGISEVSDGETGLLERRFCIGHLERGQRVGFRFLLTGNTTPNPSIHPFNHAGDVEFVPRSVGIEREDIEKVQYFIKLFVVFTLVPPIFYIVPSPLASMASALVKMVLVGLMLPLCCPIRN